MNDNFEIKKEVLLDLIISGFKKSRQKGSGVNDAKKISAEFVKNIGCDLKEHFKIDGKNYEVKYIDIDANGKRVPGEWLLDIAIVKKTPIKDSKFINRKDIKEKYINHELIWAIESEYSTSLKDFADDFGKLISVKAKNILFLGGVDQKTPKGRESYIKRRIEGLRNFFNEINYEGSNSYLAFWPSPSAKWWNEEKEKDLSGMIELYEYNCTEKNFFRIINNI